jgi:hypothetical protein
VHSAAASVARVVVLVMVMFEAYRCIFDPDNMLAIMLVRVSVSAACGTMKLM